MKRRKIEQALSFDDVLLTPSYSEILPSDVNLTTKIGELELGIPVLSAAMDTVTEHAMVIALGRIGGLGVLHRNLNNEAFRMSLEQIYTAQRETHFNYAVAVGPAEADIERIQFAVISGATAVVVDSAHGHSSRIISQVSRIRRKFPKLTVIAGNIATPEAAGALVEAGADAVKTSIGGGSICTTRIVSGVGVPTLQAVLNIYEAMPNTTVIADGGIRNSGDAVKALAAGASAFMLGGVLAGCTESPGEEAFVASENSMCKLYRGMGSADAMVAGSAERYGQNPQAKKLVPEGVKGYVKIKGTVADVMAEFLGGVRAGLGYQGSMTIPTLQQKAEFIQITNSGLKESHPHTLINPQR